jgi:hypothetical protein
MATARAGKAAETLLERARREGQDRDGSANPKGAEPGNGGFSDMVRT